MEYSSYLGEYVEADGDKERLSAEALALLEWLSGAYGACESATKSANAIEIHEILTNLRKEMFAYVSGKLSIEFTE